ncbi:class II glutamine amidotransferase [Neomoorella thermoacetica]|uniref:Glutamate synthase domain 1 n=1 Tax=Moorella thermoacetica Y72 TaxID=1325331 RepID=A0A0S6UI26_NEOTH|nr:glutamine amidotransferase family protein [Moorella thermoacetica]OIQ12972.1 glutamate synthase [NADPH] large chain precursor [Moorella thermoacetica]GAF27072.1 glutamate synthase domain 1 [Moorella thermoacetica Y72]
MLREGDYRIPSGCAISGFINKDGRRVNGSSIVQSIALMQERSNGLGGGFAAYGIYPEYKDYYALHLLFEDKISRNQVEELIKDNFYIEAEDRIPTRHVRAISKAPLLWRYFVTPRVSKIDESQETEENFMTQLVMRINAQVKGAYVVSSGKNMGAFKGVGYPEDIGEFFRLDEYRAYSWIAHGRFPTNTPGWWGGAHPFTLLDWSVVHNGEVSSYGANRRFLEMYDYKITLQTDTEVIAYAVDLLVRRHKLPLELAARVLAAPFWQEIDRLPAQERDLYTRLRVVYGSLLLNGPFSIIVGFSGGIMALNDRLKLRPLVAGSKGNTLYVASEEAAIREICPDVEEVWYPRGGEPVIGRLEEEAQCRLSA